MDNIPGIDVPYMRKLRDPMMPLPAVYLLSYRQWVTYVTIHRVNETLFAEMHGCLPAINGPERTFSISSRSSLGPKHTLRFVDTVTTEIMILVDELWKSESPSRQRRELEWEQQHCASQGMPVQLLPGDSLR